MRLQLALLGLLLAVTNAFAWDSGGHQIVDAIAYAHLNPKAKQAVDLLATQMHSSRGNYDAITLGCWMDDIRDDPAVPDDRKFRSWHYIDIPIDLKAPMPSFEPGTDDALHCNAVQALKRALAVLRGSTDPYVPDKPTALAILMHLVGDIHQPLHCATNTILVHGKPIDDRGGNLELVSNGPLDDTKFTLHRFWDEAYRASFDESSGLIRIDDFQPSQAMFTEYDNDLRKEGLAFSLEPNFDHWAKANNSVARHEVYPGLTAGDNPKLCRLSSAYVAQARVMACSLIDMAGRRLATVLNETLGGQSPPLFDPMSGMDQ